MIQNELTGRIVGGSKAVGTFVNVQDNRPIELLMKGNFFDSHATITNSATGNIVATINRNRFNFGEIFAGQQTYTVTVQPGIDMALIVAMCICLDEKNNEKKSSAAV